MVTYYDFITGYENLLRDGGEFYGVTASSTDGKMTVNQWPPVRNQIATIGKRFDRRDVIHFLNYTNAVRFGVSQELDFVQEGNEIKVALPSLKYWTMLVVEYE